MALVTNNWKIDVVILLLLIVSVIYKYITRNFNYWKDRGVPYIKPYPIIGSMGEVSFFIKPFGVFLSESYNKMKGQFYGLFIFDQPYLFIKDPNLIKMILVKDFNYFQNRSIYANEAGDPIMSRALFFLKNPEWKIIRQKLTPIFSTAKIKAMSVLVKDAAGQMNNYLKHSADLSSVEAKELCSKYSTNVIASCAFGIETNSFGDEEAKFRQVGKTLFGSGLKNIARQTSYWFCHILVKIFKFSFFEKSANAFLEDAFFQTIKERESKNYTRNDLIDIIIQMKAQDTLDYGIKFEGHRVVAPAMQFFAAGFETVSSTMAFSLYEIAVNPRIQSRLREEMKASLKEHKEFSYEAIKDMKYLHMIICEVLRKYPAIAFLDRECLQDYKVPGSDMVIEKGMRVFIPISGLHNDPEYFPDPEKFDPERFSEENIQNIRSYSFLPFGEGPRICIGERFGLFVSKLGLVHILNEFEAERNERTPVPVVFDPRSILVASKGGLPIRFKKIAPPDN